MEPVISWLLFPPSPALIDLCGKCNRHIDLKAQQLARFTGGILRHGLGGGGGGLPPTDCFERPHEDLQAVCDVCEGM